MAQVIEPVYKVVGNRVVEIRKVVDVDIVSHTASEPRYCAPEDCFPIHDWELFTTREQAEAELERRNT
jgi:hypothetical protein